MLKKKKLQVGLWNFFLEERKGEKKGGWKRRRVKGGRKRVKSHDLSAFVIYPPIHRNSNHTYIIHSVFLYFISFTLITTLKEPFFKQGNRHTMVK